jgi:hypothetical protein
MEQNLRAPVNALDLDLDAFLSNVAHWISGNRRLNSRHYIPWAQDTLRLYLEERCLLDRDNRIPGRFAVHHAPAFDYFVGITIAADAPLNVVHIDGHADLGMGDGSWVYLTSDILSRAPNDRMNPRIGPRSLNNGSYLAFLLATRRVAFLTYVHPPQAQHDLIEMYFVENDPTSGNIQLKRFSREVIAERGTLGADPLNEGDAISLEPCIPFQRIAIADYRAHNRFHNAFLCQSPGFTPRTADALIEVFSEYIDFDPAPNAVLQGD